MGHAPLLQLEESPYFVSLYNPSRRGRLEEALKLPLYPFVFGWLLVLERWRGWQGRGLRLRALSARPKRLEASLELGRLVPGHRFVVPTESIERLTFDVGPEGERELSMTVRVRYQNRKRRELVGQASFGVADVDTHREAMAVLIRIARMLGCSGYRMLWDDAARLSVELLLAPETVGARGYRDPGRPADVHPIPDDDVIDDFGPREHGRFVEPDGVNIPAPRPERVGIDVFEPGERVVAGERPRPWLLLLSPLLALGWMVGTVVGTIVGGAIVGLFGSIVSIAMSLVGVDTWWLVLSEPMTMLTVGAAMVVASFYVVPPTVALIQEALGSRVTIDWEHEYIEQGGWHARLTMPLSHVRGVDVRSSFGTRRLLLRTTEGDVGLVSGDEELTPIAVVLARALDVPVTYPEQ